MTVLSLSSSVVIIENVWLSLVTSESSEMFEGFSASLSSNQKSVSSLRFDFGKLVESVNFTTSLENSSSSILREFKSANSHLGNDNHSLVIENVTDQDKDFGSLFFGVGNFGQLGDRHGISGSSGVTESLINDSVETRVSSSSQELV